MLDTFWGTQVNPHNGLEVTRVKFIRLFLLLMGIIFCALILLTPLALEPAPWSSEIWLFQAVQGMHADFHMVPWLNRLPLTGHNPINVLLLSLSPWTDIFSLRLLSILLGCIITAGIFLFSVSLWDQKTAFFSTLLTITSCGFIISYSTLNTSVIPGSLCMIAFLIFSLVYLKGMNSWWYILSYLLIGIATITGGWTLLAFFSFGILFLILFDLAPRKFLEIRLVSGILLIAVILVAAYATYRIIAGGTAASSIFVSDTGSGFWVRIWILTKYTLPWVFLVLPSWLYSEVAEKKDAWRSLLPVKIGLVMGAAILLFSNDYNEGYAFLAVPFSGMLSGYWIAHRFAAPEKAASIKNIFLAATGIVIAASAIIISATVPITHLSINLTQALPIIIFVIAAAVIFWFAKRHRHMAMIILCMAVVFTLTWSIALVRLPGSTTGIIKAVEEMSTYSPIVIYRDDLTMRGYIDYAGIQPIIVSRGIVPIDESVYLAACTKDLDDLLKDLNSRMYTQLITSYKDHQTYALIKISPLAIDQ